MLTNCIHRFHKNYRWSMHWYWLPWRHDTDIVWCENLGWSPISLFLSFLKERGYRSLRAHYASAHWREWFCQEPPPGENPRRQRWKSYEIGLRSFWTWTDWPNLGRSAACARRSCTGTMGRWWSITPPSTTGWRRRSWTPSLSRFHQTSQELFWNNFSLTSWFFSSMKVTLGGML